MIEDLQDELPKTIKKAYRQNSGNHKLLSVFVVWFIFVAVFFVACLGGLKTTFRNKTKEQVLKEAKEYAQSIETKPMQLFYVCSDGITVKPFTIKVEVTGAGSYYDALEGLLKDTPSEVLKDLCINAIPKGTVLKSVKVNKNKASIELTNNNNLTSYYNLLKLQIQNTIIAVNPEITEVEIILNNQQI